MKWREAQPSTYHWLQRRIGLTPTAHFRAIEAVREDGTIAGQVGYDQWANGGVMLHIALDSPVALRCLIVEGFRRAFEVSRREVVVAPVRSDNRASLELVQHLGFKRCGEIPNYHGPGVSLVLWHLQKSKCRWLYGKKRKA